MREELKEQSKRARQDREESERLGREEKASRDGLKHKFRFATYSMLELKEAEVEALEWFYERPNLLENREIYAAISEAYPITANFISKLGYVNQNTKREDWLKTEAFPDDDFDDFLDELPSLCHDYGIWKDRFVIVHKLDEEDRKKRPRFWLWVLAIAILFFLIISVSD